MLGTHPVDDEGWIGRFAGVIEATSVVGFVSATAEDQKIGAQSAPARFVAEAEHVMRSDGAFEAVKEHKPRCAVRGVEAVDVDEVGVGSVPALAANRGRRMSSKELAPERLCVSAANPPCGAESVFWVSGHDQSYSRARTHSQPAGVLRFAQGDTKWKFRFSA